MSNRQVAKNAVYLYLRTIVTTIVGIYTSRVVLQTLGIEDYGLYNVVGGVVGLFGFINGAMSGSTSRFITFELGKGDKQRLHDTFNSAMIVHLIIAGIVLILAETVGLWFLYNKLVISEGRMWAAQWVYQLSIISALFSVTQVPYDAVLIAHERFDVSAYISMFSTFAKLGVLYLVAYLPYDNLISYAILILLITVLTRMFARFYCAKHFEESKFRWVVNRELLKPMLNFSGWEMFGRIGFVVYDQGRVILVNVFYGVVVNAAVAVANTLSGAVNGFAFNIVQAFRPSITKSAGSGNEREFYQSVSKAGYLSFLLFSTISIPLIIERNYVFELWLGTVPTYAADICAINLLFSNLMMLSIVLNVAIQAVGKNKKQNLYPATVNVLLIVLMYIFLYYGVSLVIVFLFLQLTIIYSFANAVCLFARYVSKTIVKRYLLHIVVRSLIGFCVQFIVVLLISKVMEMSLFRLVFVSLSSIGVSSVVLLCGPYGFAFKSLLKQAVMSLGDFLRWR